MIFIMSDLFSALRGYKLGSFILFAGIVATVVTITFIQTPVFEVSSSIIVPHEKGQESFSSTKKENAGSHTAIEMLRGNVLAEQVITSLGATQLFHDLEQDTQGQEDLLRLAVYAFKRRLAVHLVDRTGMIRISFRHQEPEIALQVVNTLIRLFRKQYKRVQNPQSSVQEEQLLVYRRQLRQAENVLSMFRQKNRMVSFEGRKENIASQYKKMKSLLVTEKEKLKEFSEHLEKLNQRFIAVAEAVERREGVRSREDFTEARDNFLQLKLYEYELIRKYDEGDQLIADVRQQIKIIRKGICNQENPSGNNRTAEECDKLDTVANHVVLSRIAYSRQLEKGDFIQRRFRQLENKSQRFAELDGMLNELRLEVENSKAQYAKYAQEIEEKENPAAFSSYVSVIEKPMLPLKLIRPKKLRDISLAILLGSLCGLLYAFLRKAWSERYPTNSQ